jgi:N-glycosylase/DNA lyase
MNVIRLVSDMATVHTDLQTALRARAANDTVFSIDIVRDALNNQVVAYITYEAAP